MPDQLRFCFMRCCHFVNDQPASRSEYESAVERNRQSLILPGPIEWMIPCRVAGVGGGSRVQEAAETEVGFYLGSGVRRAYGNLVQDGNMPAVFDKRSGKFLRVATADDVKQWNNGWRAAVENERKAQP